MKTSQPLNFNSKFIRKLNLRRKKKYLISKAKKYQDIEFDDERYSKIIDMVFTENNFIRQVNEVKARLPDIESELVEEVIKFHIKMLSKEITKVRPWKRIVYIHRWARIDIWPLCFNPYSVYFALKRTMKQLRKYGKEVKQILNK